MSDFPFDGTFRNIGDGIEEYEIKIRSTKHV